MKIIPLIWRRVILPACAVYTVLTLVLILFMYGVSGSSENPALTLRSALSLLAMSVLIALSSLIFYYPKLSMPVRTIINFFLTLASVIVITLIGSYDVTGRPLVLVVVFTVIYLALVPVSILVYSIIKKKISEDTDYKSVFSNDDDH